MLDLIEKVEKLKNELDNSELIKEIKKLNEEISNDKELLENIKIYQKTKSLEVKEKIFQNENYIHYKQLENEINLVILQIKSSLKSINDISCGGKHENN